MAREISQEAIEAGELTYLEAKYLRDRGRLPKGYEMPDPPEVGDRAARPSRVTPLEEQSVPTIGRNGGIVADNDDEDEAYDDGWNNNQRRAELSKRGLSVEGKKDDLIGRLRRSDADELIDGDESEIDN